MGAGERHESVWLCIRPWVCLAALVARQRAFPCWQPEGTCESWEDDDAFERAVLANAAHTRNSEMGQDSKDWMYLAAAVVLMPPDLLAKVLEFAFDGSGEVFAPIPAPFIDEDDMLLVEFGESSASHASSSSACVNPRICTHRLLDTGSCVHGKIVGRGRSFWLECWYCECTFPHPSGADDLETH